MKSFNTSFEVCLQNFRRLMGDYRIFVTLGIIFVVSNYHASVFIDFAQINFPDTGVSPWIFPFAFTAYIFNKIMLFLPLLLLFCDAPFIDKNQPYIIARCTRRVWSVGQIFYIVALSGIYVLCIALMMPLMLIGNMDLTAGWGDAIISAARSPQLEYAAFTGVSERMVTSFSPIAATVYSIILTWLACIFLGLLIYVINAATGKSGFGVMASSFFIIIDPCIIVLCSSDKQFDFLYRFSPLSWCSVNRISILEADKYPSIGYVFFGYIFLIAALSAIAIFISKKQEIKVIQAV